MHRDVKPENILLEERRDSLYIKLVDFGTASTSQHKLRGAVGTAYYIAPEVLTSTYTEKCDVWSCGVIMYILLSGQPPFKGRSDPEILESVKTAKVTYDGEPWSEISAEAKSLLQALLCPQQVRLSALKALQHPWILQNTKSKLPDAGVMSPVMERLRQFNTSNKLRDAVETFIITQCLTVKDVRSLRQVFQTIDKDGDGKLSREELLEEYSKTSADPSEDVDRIMKAVDTDNNGFIDYSEFIKATLDRRQLLSAANLQRAFKAFDRDESGSISAQELKAMLQGSAVIEEQVWAQIIEEIDQNGDGEIDLEEFQTLLFSKM